MQFEDVDELSESVQDWDLEFRQLKPGSFKGHIIQIGRKDWQIGSARIANATEQVGLPPENLRTVVITLDSLTQLNWRGHAVTGQDLMIFPDGGELHAVGDENFGNLAISFPESALKNRFPAEKHLLDGPEVQSISRRSMAALRGILLHFLEGELNRKSQDFVEPDPLAVLASVLATATDQDQRRARRKRDLALDGALKLLRADTAGRLSIKSLAARLQVGARTLDLAFRETFGLTPAAYRKAFRLNAVHRHLRQADPASTLVKDIALHHGFQHLSQFAADYRAHFGVVPSVTLGAGKTRP